MAGIISYASYYLELSDKIQFCKLWENKKMSIDFKNILSSLPEGIILYDEET